MKHTHLAAAGAASVIVAGLFSAGIVSAHGGFGAIDPTTAAERQMESFQHDADLLGVNLDIVKNGWAQGKDVRQIAQEQGISQADLQARMQTERKNAMSERLNALVSKGVITQEQADQRKAALEKADSNPRGFPGFHGGPRGGGPSVPEKTDR